MKVDNLIIGGGIAGTWLGFQAHKAGKSFVLLDSMGFSNSSGVAAGIFNPVLIARKKKSYNCDIMYKHIDEWYTEMQDFIGAPILHHDRIAYILDQAEAANDWATLAEDEAFKPYVSICEEKLSSGIQQSFGYLDIRYSGWVDVNTMLQGFRRAIKSPNAFVDEAFQPSELKETQGSFQYKDIAASRIIFCQGTAINSNPFTSHIKLGPAKGEILVIRTPEAIKGHIPQNGVFMLPLGNNTYKVGSNFEWEDLSMDTTEKARKEIVSKFTKWYKGDFEVIDQYAGVRPSSMDRRPLLGRISQNSAMYIFNGLGSKGVALAPYYSKILLDHMYDGISIDKEVDVNRLIR